MNVPFLDLKAQFREIEHEVLPMVKEAMENAAFIGGPQVTGFEAEFAAFCDSKLCAGVNSGTDAIRFALMAAGVGPGDEVVTVPHTFIATTEAISQVGAKPVFVDIDPKTYNMDPNKLEDYLRKRLAGGSTRNQEPGTSPVGWAAPTASAPRTQSRPKAVLPVHIYGQPADMDPIMEIAGKHNLVVIEDACQAHGALYKGKKAGSMGLAGAFSFYPGKNLGAYGEGGAVVTQSEDMANKIRMIRDHGQAKKYYHDLEGYNGRLDAIQAGVLRIKLRRLEAWNESRRRNAALYDELLSSIPGVTIPFQADFATSVYHLYVILVDDRDGLQKYLGEKGVGSGLHYPVPLHLQKAYASDGYKEGDFPVTESVARRLLSLPMFPELKKDQIEYVAACIKQFMTKN
jgi:dTDP-4-amino-4,6-dideoxygalactose transaminase